MTPKTGTGLPRALKLAIRDLTWGIPIVVIVFVVFGPTATVLYVIAGVAIRALTSDLSRSDSGGCSTTPASPAAPR